MPRKQRFKPSRKPQVNPQQAASQSLDDRKEIIPEPQHEVIERHDDVIRGEPDLA